MREEADRAAERMSLARTTQRGSSGVFGAADEDRRQEAQARTG